MIKNKAYIFLEVVIISFLFISLTLFVQILLNNSFKLYKVDYETQENFQNLDFLNEIMKSEIRHIEKNINNGNIKNASEYIVLNEDGEKIFLTTNPSKRISLGGYNLLNNEIKINSYSSTINVNFKKKITMSITTQETYRKEGHLPQKVTLSEEVVFFTKIDNGEIKVKSNDEVLANLKKIIG